jgi:hypothetical protein
MKRHGYGQGMGADGAAIQAKFSKGEGGRRSGRTSIDYYRSLPFEGFRD